MKTFEEADAAARPGPAFSNSTEYELWRDRWCDRCAHDTEEQVDRGEGCPLVLIGLMGKTPAEWKRRKDHSYRCTAFVNLRDVSLPEPAPPAWQEIPGQAALVSIEECGGARRGS